jgi:hypothetical protein
MTFLLSSMRSKGSVFLTLTIISWTAVLLGHHLLAEKIWYTIYSVFFRDEENEWENSTFHKTVGSIASV